MIQIVEDMACNCIMRDWRSGGCNIYPKVDLSLGDVPASQHDVSHRLAGQGVGQQFGHSLQPAGHPLQRPEDTREEETRIERSNGELHSQGLGVTQARDEETEAHPGEALQESDDSEPGHGTSAGDVEDEEDEGESDGGLDDHHPALGHDVAGQNLRRLDPRHPRSLQQTCGPLRDESFSCESHGQEVDDDDDDPGRLQGKCHLQ